jgi:hypothetical protein
VALSGVSQELEYLDVTQGLVHGVAPGGETVSGDQEAGDGVARPEDLPHLVGQRVHVLRVLHDGGEDLRLVRRDAAQPLQHLVAAERQPRPRGVVLAHQSPGDRGRVQHGRCAGPLDDGHVHPRLRRRASALPWHRCGVGADGDEVRGTQ